MIVNKTKSNVICSAEKADTFFRRALGLMFRKRRNKDEGLLIEFFPGLKSRSVHSFFMRFPIDLIFISEDLQVVDLETLEPWRFYSPKKQCRWVLEVNKGVIKEKNIELGDVLEFKSYLRII